MEIIPNMLVSSPAIRDSDLNLTFIRAHVRLGVAKRRVICGFPKASIANKTLRKRGCIRFPSTLVLIN
jgi:hypothetical protein